MPRFRYKSVTPAGELVEGELVAVDRLAAIGQLHGDGHTPIRADEVGEGPIARLAAIKILGGRGLSYADLVLLTHELATLLHAGLPLDRSLVMLADLADGGAKRRFVNGLLESVQSGATLAEALERRTDALPSFYIGMVRAGEAGGNLDTVLTRLAEVLARMQALRETVKSAMYYPIIVLVVAGLSIGFLLTAVVPQFRPLFESSGAALPETTKIVIALGDMLREYWWLILAALVGLALLVRFHYARPAGRLTWDALLLRIPILGDIALKAEVARFSRTLGTLLASGVVALNALSIAVNTLSNRKIAREVADLAGKLKKGEGLAGPLLQTGIFPKLAVQLVQVGEETGQLDSMLLRIADTYDEGVKRTLQRLLALLVPAITVGLGLLVATIIGSMLTAILSAYELPL
jgi:general secretion pathway protein F